MIFVCKSGIPLLFSFDCSAWHKQAIFYRPLLDLCKRMGWNNMIWESAIVSQMSLWLHLKAVTNRMSMSEWAFRLSTQSSHQHAVARLPQPQIVSYVVNITVRSLLCGLPGVSTIGRQKTLHKHRNHGTQFPLSSKLLVLLLLWLSLISFGSFLCSFKLSSYRSFVLQL